MAVHFKDLELGTEKSSIRCLINDKLWLRWVDFERESEVSKEIAIRNHGPGEQVTSDFGVKLVFNPGNILDVVDVPVRQQQKFGVDIERTDPFARTLRCVEQDPSL